MVMPLRPLLAAFLLASTATSALAGRNALKPADFEPLTSLPWKWPGATMESVLDAIFREPNPAIRYPVLGEYLRTIPVAQLGRAFDLCLDLEGAQTPDSLTEFFLPIWARRDPKTCWKRTRELFRLVGFEEGWLSLDRWKNRPRITVQDRAAINASKFWIEHRETLVSFAEGVDQSSLPRKERVRIMKEFTDLWFTRFGSWPGLSFGNPTWGSPADWRNILSAFDEPGEHLRGYTLESARYDGAHFEIAMRRWMETEPGSGLDIIKHVQATDWHPPSGGTERHAGKPSAELLNLWARGDLLAIIRWAESLDIRKDQIALEARGLLMNRVDRETRDRWQAEANADDTDEGLTETLLVEWAKWDPKAALDAAVSTGEADTIESVASTACSARGDGVLLNINHFALGVVQDFDVAALPTEIRHNVMDRWEVILQYLAPVDVGEAARYGLDLMLRTDFAPRENLIKLFSGDDAFSSDADMIDRTFCALRVWAVVKPREMKAWITTQKDADMRKALTWLLEHPWGTGPKE